MNMSLYFDKIKITYTRTETSYYNPKTKKHVDYKKPKVTTKIIFEDSCYDIGELYLQLKNCHDRGYDKVQVSFISEQHY